MKNTIAALSIILSTLFSVNCYAGDYKVEVLIFKNLSQNQAFESNTDIQPKKPSSNSRTWAIQKTMLNDEASKIKRSADYQLVSHLAWGQRSLPYSKSAAYQLSQQDINGWIKIYANNLLYINLDLDLAGFHLKEKRKVKLDERHFFDHPKYGILMQVSRLIKD